MGEWVSLLLQEKCAIRRKHTKFPIKFLMEMHIKRPHPWKNGAKAKSDWPGNRYTSTYSLGLGGNRRHKARKAKPMACKVPRMGSNGISPAITKDTMHSIFKAFKLAPLLSCVSQPQNPALYRTHTVLGHTSVFSQKRTCKYATQSSCLWLYTLHMAH